MTTQAQLDAILHGAVFAPITDKGFLRITGPDATRWLNGMVTNNIKDLKPGEGNYNFLLNAQGRIQADCTIYRDGAVIPTEFILESDASQIDEIHNLLDKFIIMDDVELSRDIYVWSRIHLRAGLLLVGEGAGDILLKLISEQDGKPFAALPQGGTQKRVLATSIDETIWILRAASVLVPMFELWFADFGFARDFMETLKLSGATQASPETLEAFRIYSGTPKYGIDIRNTETAKDLPQETAQHHALNFNKGCYLGQEIVERIHSRGQVHRTFTRFTLTGTPPTELPAPLETNGKPAGEITSVACIHDEKLGDTLYALGYARREALDTHATLTYAGGTAVPLIPNP